MHGRCFFLGIVRLCILLVGIPGLLCLPAQAQDEGSVAPEATAVALPAQDPTLEPEKLPSSLSLLPYLQFTIMPLAEILEDVESLEGEHIFSPYKPNTWLQHNGPVWFTFPLSILPAAPSREETNWYLNLGAETPDLAKVWHRNAHNDIIPLGAVGPGLFPLPSSEDDTILIRLEGLPGIWFAPTVHTLASLTTDTWLRAHQAGMLVLGILALLCFVRSVTDRNESRVWAGVFAAAVLVQAFWGVPSLSKGILPLAELPGLIGIAIALILLPQLGRITMQTADTAPWIDTLLLALTIPFTLCAMLPLLPSMAWVAPLLHLWPLAALLLLIPALIQVWREIPGSGLYTVFCLSLSLSTAFSLWGMGKNLHPSLMGVLPLWGMSVAVFFLAAAPRYIFQRSDGTIPAAAEDPLHEAALIPDPAADPALALEIEEALRLPLDSLLRESCALDLMFMEKQDMPADEARLAKLRTEALVASCREMAALVAEIPYISAGLNPQEKRRKTFDLRQVIQSVFADIQIQIKDKNLGLGWYVSPHMGLLYKGDRDRLRFILSMFLDSAVRATSEGAVSLRVQRDKNSTNPGQLQFIISDSGSGQPPLQRSSLMLARAWELAAGHNGTFTVNSTPFGTTIAFSLRCTAMHADGTECSIPPAKLKSKSRKKYSLPLLLVVSGRSAQRELLSSYLEDSRWDIWEAQTPAEAMELCVARHANAIVLDTHFKEEDMITAIAAIRNFEGEHSLPAAPVLSLCLQQEQAERMYRAGCEESIFFPLLCRELRGMAEYMVLGDVGPRPLAVAIPYPSPSRTDSPPYVQEPDTAPPQAAVLSQVSLPAPEEETTLQPVEAAAILHAPVPSTQFEENGQNRTAGGKADHTQGETQPPIMPVEMSPPVPSFDVPELGETPIYLERQTPPKPLSTPPLLETLSFLPGEETSHTDSASAQQTAAEQTDVATEDAEVSPAQPSSQPEPDPVPPEVFASQPLSVVDPDVELVEVQEEEPRPKSSSRKSAAKQSSTPPMTQGLLLTPPPKKRFAWFTERLKPTPQLSLVEEEETFSLSNSEWVGDPIPVTVSPAQSTLSTPAKTQQDAVEARALWDDSDINDEEVVVGDPMPIPSPAKELEPRQDEEAQADTLSTEPHKEQEVQSVVASFAIAEQEAVDTVQVGAQTILLEPQPHIPEDAAIQIVPLNPMVEAPQKKSSRSKRKKQHKQHSTQLPFLSLNPEEEQMPSSTPAVLHSSMPNPLLGNEEQEDDILELTEQDMLSLPLSEPSALLQHMEAYIAQLHDALARQDFNEVEQTALTISSQAITAELPTLAALSQELYAAAQGHDTHKLEQFLQEMGQEMEGLSFQSSEERNPYS